MKNTILCLLILCVVKLSADPITVIVTLTDDDQWSYQRILARFASQNTNYVGMKLTDFVVGTFDQSRTNTTSLEKQIWIQEGTAVYVASDPATKAQVRALVGITNPPPSVVNAVKAP